MGMNLAPQRELNAACKAGWKFAEYQPLLKEANRVHLDYVKIRRTIWDFKEARRRLRDAEEKAARTRIVRALTLRVRQLDNRSGLVRQDVDEGWASDRLIFGRGNSY